MATHESHEKKLMEAFLVAAGGDEDGLLCKPGVEGLNSFFATCLPKEFLGAVRIRKVYADLDHDEDADLSLKELEDFAVRLKETAAGQDEADIEVEPKPALDINALVEKSRFVVRPTSALFRIQVICPLRMHELSLKLHFLWSIKWSTWNCRVTLREWSVRRWPVCLRIQILQTRFVKLSRSVEIIISGCALTLWRSRSRVG